MPTATEQTISEAASKKKRGRPRAIPLRVYNDFPEVTTSRQQQSKYYGAIAYGVLMEADYAAGNPGPTLYPWLRGRTEILAELGRLLQAGYLTAGDVRQYADRACREKPNTKTEVARLRAIRIEAKQGRKPK